MSIDGLWVQGIDDASRGLQKKRKMGICVLRNVVVSLDLSEMSVDVLSKNGSKRQLWGRVKESGCVVDDGGEHKGKEKERKVWWCKTINKDSALTLLI